MPAKTGTPAPAGFMWIEAAAKELRVQKCTLYKWRYRGIGPKAIRHAGRLMYAESAVKGYWADLIDAEQPTPLRAPRPHVAA
ncbi:hypothetical protein ACFZDG_18240 [Kitasatospora xanthocidica]|uniref:hypothetical protein n=1 Tax=Kitasatospora xanthocidica TaxID=83382 RepID=UPI0036EADA6A